MATFKDNTSREWNINLNAWTYKQIRENVGVDVLDIGKHDKCQPLFDRLRDDPFLLCDILCIALNRDVITAGITDAEFAEAIGADTIGPAVDAVFEAIIDFHPSAKRPVLRKVIDNMRAIDGKLRDQALKLLDDPRLEQVIDAAIATAV